MVIFISSLTMGEVPSFKAVDNNGDLVELLGWSDGLLKGNVPVV